MNYWRGGGGKEFVVLQFYLGIYLRFTESRSFAGRYGQTPRLHGKFNIGCFIEFSALFVSGEEIRANVCKWEDMCNISLLDHFVNVMQQTQ